MTASPAPPPLFDAQSLERRRRARTVGFVLIANPVIQLPGLAAGGGAGMVTAVMGATAGMAVTVATAVGTAATAADRRALRHFRLVLRGIDRAPLLAELAAADALWTADAGRQSRIAVQRD